MLFLVLKRVRMIKYTPPQVTNNQKKIAPSKIFDSPLTGEISPPANDIWKTPAHNFFWLAANFRLFSRVQAH